MRDLMSLFLHPAFSASAVRRKTLVGGRTPPATSQYLATIHRDLPLPPARLPTDPKKKFDPRAADNRATKSSTQAPTDERGDLPEQNRHRPETPKQRRSTSLDSTCRNDLPTNPKYDNRKANHSSEKNPNSKTMKGDLRR
jgi:hypothetical protein